jgi:small subunit ribosomal protein S16
MPVKIRLTRMGKKKQPTYRVVVMDSRKPRDGKYIEQIGRYDPRQDPSIIEIDNERALSWLRQGAQPSDRARKLLEISGAWTQFKVAKGEIHTIDDTPTPAVDIPGEIHVVGDAPAEAAAEPEEVEAEEVEAEEVVAEPEAKPVAAAEAVTAEIDTPVAAAGEDSADTTSADEASADEASADEASVAEGEDA